MNPLMLRSESYELYNHNLNQIFCKDFYRKKWLFHLIPFNTDGTSSKMKSATSIMLNIFYYCIFIDLSLFFTQNHHQVRIFKPGQLKFQVYYATQKVFLWKSFALTNHFLIVPKVFKPREYDFYWRLFTYQWTHPHFLLHQWRLQHGKASLRQRYTDLQARTRK